MTREILFRGKRGDNGEWVEGLLPMLNYIKVFMPPIYPFINEIQTADDVAIDEDTLGQFTGLFDKNGKRIFEGDIVTYGNQNYMVKWDDINARFICISEFSWNVHRNKYTKGQGNTLCYLSSVLEVIGNIHDNPELLEDEE